MKKQHQIVFAAAFTIAVIAVVFAVNWATSTAREIGGPTTLVQDDAGHIWTQTADTLWTFDAAGKLVARRTAAELGIANFLGPICPLPHGEMLVGSRDPNRVYWIDGRGKIKRVIDPGTMPNVGGLFSAYHLAFDGESRFIYVTDSSNHRLLVFDSDGKFLRGEGAGFAQSTLFRFPNQVRIVDDNAWIADTNHQQLKVLGKDLHVVRRINLANAGEYTYRWPVMFDRDAAGDIYVIQDGERLKKGQVVKYSSEGQRLNVFTSPPEREPGGVLVLGDTLLVSGRESFDIQRFGLDGRAQGAFGDETFAGEMQTQKAYRDKLQAFATYSPFGILILLVLAYIAYLREVRRKSGAAATSAPLSMAGSANLHVRAAVVLMFSLARVVVPAWVVVMLLSFVAMALNMLLQGRTPTPGLSYLVSFVLYMMCAFALEHIYLRVARSGFLDPLQESSRRAFLARYASLRDKLFQPGEVIVQMRAGLERHSAWPQYYVLTNMRLLIFDLDLLGTSVKRVTEFPLAPPIGTTVLSLDIELARWLRGLPPVSTLSLKAGEFSLGFYFAADRDALEFAKSLNDAAIAPSMQTGTVPRVLPLDGSKDPMDSGRVYSGNPSVGASAFASALLPGLGQMLQRRFLTGIVILTIAGLWAIETIAPLSTYFLKTADIHVVTVMRACLPVVILWLANIVDAYLYARKFR